MIAHKTNKTNAFFYIYFLAKSAWANPFKDVSRGLCEVTQFARHGMCATSVNNTASVAKNGIYISF